MRYLLPDTSTVKTDSGPLIVTAGLQIVSTPNATLTFTNGNLITITNPGYGPFSTYPFNGLDILFLSGATINTVLVDLASDPSLAAGALISFTANDIRVNLSGSCKACGANSQNLLLDVNAVPSAVTPEPSSLVLLGTGILGLCGGLRRRFLAGAA